MHGLGCFFVQMPPSLKSAKWRYILALLRKSWNYATTPQTLVLCVAFFFLFFVGFCFCFSLVAFFSSKHATSTYQSPKSKPSVAYHLKMEHEDTRTRKFCNAACEDVITTNRPTPWVLSVIESG